MSLPGNPSRRLDVYAERNKQEKWLRKKCEFNRARATTFRHGSETDAFGRFVGAGDVDRGLAHFNAKRMDSDQVTK
jgi:hypothetical protein